SWVVDFHLELSGAVPFERLQVFAGPPGKVLDNDRTRRGDSKACPIDDAVARHGAGPQVVLRYVDGLGGQQRDQETLKSHGLSHGRSHLPASTREGPCGEDPELTPSPGKTTISISDLGHHFNREFLTTPGCRAAYRRSVLAPKRRSLALFV